jgi:hypothetical protein
MPRSLVIVVLLAMGLPATAQDRLFSSEGKFQESRSTSLREPAARGLGAPGRPFDVLSYRLLLELAMTDEMLTGRMTIRLVLIQPADSIRLHAAALSLDSVLVDSSPC